MDLLGDADTWMSNSNDEPDGILYDADTKIEILKSLREGVNWENEEERVEFLRRIFPLLVDWRCGLPNVLDIFRREEIELLISDSVDYWGVGDDEVRGYLFAEFVARSGYKDESSELDGRPLPRHVALVHRVFGRRNLNKNVVANLFELYPRFDAAHFHAACGSGLVDVVEKFLEHGQVDPNHLVPETGDSPLHLALGNNYKKVAESLLRRGADPNLANDNDGKTPLHVLCRHSSKFDSLRSFFKICAELNQPVLVDARDKCGRTALHWAMRHEHARTAELLLRRGADPNAADEDEDTPLHTFCRARTRDDDRLLRRFFKINQELKRTVRVDARDKEGSTTLHLALHYGYGKIAVTLLRNGADPNLADAKGSTPLHFLCRKSCQVDLLKTLFEIGDETHRPVQIDARDNEGRTPLFLAMRHNFYKIAVFLLRRGADPNASDTKALFTPWKLVISRASRSDDFDLEAFFEAIGDEARRRVQINGRNKRGHTSLCIALGLASKRVAEWLLRRGADPDAVTVEGLTPLHLLCRNSKDKYSGLAEWLLEIGEDVMGRPLRLDARDDLGRTPLYYALKRASKTVAELLLRRGADPNLADAEGWTPLHVICRMTTANSPDEIAKSFFDVCDEMQLEVEIDARDKLGWTALNSALYYGNKRAAELLLRRGADPNVGDAEGFTPLHVICDRAPSDDTAEWFFEICQEVDRPVLVDARNDFGETPLHLAAKGGHRDLVRWLLRKGADPNAVNEIGLTCLHRACDRDKDEDDGDVDDDELARMLLDDADPKYRPVLLDAPDCDGDTPLYLALIGGHRRLAELLLRRGADPNHVDKEGCNALHMICSRYSSGEEDDDFLDMFFRIVDELNRPVEIDARDDEGNTPLLCVAEEARLHEVELLMRRGADPNAANDAGTTVLHYMCKDYYKGNEKHLRDFFEMSSRMGKRLRVDARDAAGLTPLETAVAGLSPAKVDVLLDNGADLANFVFPGVSYYEDIFERLSDDADAQVEFKLCLATGLMEALACLEKRGYALVRSDALTIVKVLVKFEAFEESTRSQSTPCYEDMEFAEKAKKIWIPLNPGISFYDFIRLSSERAAEVFTTSAYYMKLLRTKWLNVFSEMHRGWCIARMCDNVLRRFLRRCATDFFLELTRHRLPVLCCDSVIEQTMCQDLCNICLAAELGEVRD
ncbi:ankyrin-1-like [Trichogramma pretiosum]|uniref:ankyrin-1-like n=1 Tax=Trichogramma pretiosum TaxID=7493 RepID=UPI0006C9876B|nr:ankyrin-1-like [Trichogramma pretiosum]XP_014225673.1 ankyrin-1-like [Trichogramma pretiosum]XP_023318322.1 ankyrin-1-like [Trichogramma pretiosum]